ncbi:MAG: hypothetical protein N2515_03990, partial [Deltaproteobacteria bacterium]|nr:hypothetical protein [Deltaproteobacteria bacterium]
MAKPWSADESELNPLPEAEGIQKVANAFVWAGLMRSAVSIDEALKAFESEKRMDLTGLPLGAAAYFIARAQEKIAKPFVVVAPDNDSARAVASDLRFFRRGLRKEKKEKSGEQVLVLPAPEISPYLELNGDRRLSMQRMATLARLSRDEPWDVLVVSGPALLRKNPPKQAILRRLFHVKNEEPIDREGLIRALVEGGYLRVPLVEDPGSFAVRGGVIDVFPGASTHPFRIELDGEWVVSIRRFDPEDQTSLEAVNELIIGPVREVMLGQEEIARAKRAIRDRADDMGIPTRQSRLLVDDIEAGRMLPGIEALLPAFYGSLETLFDLIPGDAHFVLFDPVAIARGIDEEMRRVEADHHVRVEKHSVCFPPSELFAKSTFAVNHIIDHPFVLIHKVMAGGEQEETEGAIKVFLSGDPEKPYSLGAEDHSSL